MASVSLLNIQEHNWENLPISERFAIPIDDVPEAPAWANATMNPDQEGEMILEWAACTELQILHSCKFGDRLLRLQMCLDSIIPGTNHPSFRSKYNFN